MKYTGHRKIIHIGIDTLCPNDATRSPATLGAQHPSAMGLIDLLCEYTDLIESIGDDQFLLDVTYNRLEIPFGARIAKIIKSDIKRELGVGVSMGMGPTKFLARLAMESQRPDGLTVIRPDQLAAFLTDIPIDQLPGVGAITQNQLAEIGIEYVGQLARTQVNVLVRHLGPRGRNLWLLARGLDEDPVNPAERPRHICEETSFDTPTYSREEIHLALRELSDTLSGRLRRRAQKGRDLVLQIRYANAQTETRTSRLPHPTNQSLTLLGAAIQLVEHTTAYQSGIRLLSIDLSDFDNDDIEQLDLFALGDATTGQP